MIIKRWTRLTSMFGKQPERYNGNGPVCRDNNNLVDCRYACMNNGIPPFGVAELKKVLEDLTIAIYASEMLIIVIVFISCICNCFLLVKDLIKKLK